MSHFPMIVSLDNCRKVQTTWFLGADKAKHAFSSSPEISCFLLELEETMWWGTSFERGNQVAYEGLEIRYKGKSRLGLQKWMIERVRKGREYLVESTCLKPGMKSSVSHTCEWVLDYVARYDAVGFFLFSTSPFFFLAIAHLSQMSDW